MKTLSMPIIRNQDIQQTLGAISTVQVSRILKNLRDKRLLVSAPGAEYKYQLGISKSPLLRMVMRQLDRNGFLPLRNEV
jgi:DNA-binding IscR family transcriptional regulator